LRTRLSLLRAIGVIALLIASLALAACGGDDDDGALSKEDYRSQAQKISDEYEKEATPALEAAQSKDPEESLTGVTELADRSTSTANKLDPLEPPEEYKDVHGRLIGALRTVGQRGEKVEQAAEAQDEAAIESAVDAFQQSLVELDRVGDEHEKTTGVS
jgi:hypothetical protein